MTKKRLKMPHCWEENLSALGLSSVLSDFHEGVLIANTKGEIVYYNTAMGRIDDIDPDYAIGKIVVELYDLTEQQSTTMLCLATKKPIINKPLFYQTRLGQVTNSLVNTYPLYIGTTLIGAICFVNEYHMVEKKYSTPQVVIPADSERKNGTRFSFTDIIGRRTDLEDIVRVAQKAAVSPSPVLIIGDTGTGKELFAQAIHNFSAFKENAFVPINCAAIPENLLEGILFGTSKGAFTGSIDKAGLFEQANGGTLFLDELNSMPLSLQAKMLRVIQEKKVRRVGSQNEKSLNLKIISSVNQDPMEEIKRGNLRQDLFYRLGVVFIQIPPLRARKGDLSKLIYHFIDKYNKKLKKNVSGVSPLVDEFFTSYHWPGNVRELEHVIEGSMNLVGREQLIEKIHLPQYFLRSACSANIPSTGDLSSSHSDSAMNQFLHEIAGEKQSMSKLDEIYCKAQREMIQRALNASQGNVVLAVKSLGLSSPQALQYKMKKLKLKRTDFLL